VVFPLGSIHIDADCITLFERRLQVPRPRRFSGPRRLLCSVAINPDYLMNITKIIISFHLTKSLLRNYRIENFIFESEEVFRLE
jgi:hypothetical protein